MFTTIIAATDSVVGKDASVMSAAYMAAEYKTQLYVLHILESAHIENRHYVKHFATGHEVVVNSDYLAEVVLELENSMGDLLKNVPRWEIRVRCGLPWAEILRRSREVNADLIVMGPHANQAEEKGVVRVAGKIGSTVQGVVTHENCPVMIVNCPVTVKQLLVNKILVGIDFSVSCECAVCFAVKLAQKYESIIYPFHMIPVPPYPKYSKADYEADLDNAKQRLVKFCHPYLDGTKHEYQVWGGVQPHLELLKCADLTKSDLIILGSHTKERAGKWYAGSTVERVSYRAQCPVIVINDPDVLRVWQDISIPAQKTEQPVGDRFIRGFSGKRLP